jgi:transcriptional regulator of acetoin/glycerol metabolism
MLEHLFGSPSRFKLLTLFLGNHSASFGIREAARLIGTSPRAIQLQLKKLIASGLLLVEPKGKRNLYRVNPAHPFYLELRSLLCKVARSDPFIADLIKEPLSIAPETYGPLKSEEYCWGDSPKIQRVYALIERTAPSDVTVLMEGETGSGKGVLVRLIHKKSRRRDEPFIPVNTAGIPETLLESELFGHKKGSFTGAICDKAGLFEAAEQGTIFLDEIANASPALQAKILEAVEEKTIRRVGETKTRKIDARFICATNRDLWKGVKENWFREDLYYRLKVITIRVPALRVWEYG